MNEDKCEFCGELTSCVCLGAIADDWAIYKGDPLYTFQWWKDEHKGEGSAKTYREAMDEIANAIKANELEEASK